MRAEIPLLTRNFPSPEELKREISEKGFAVYKDAVSLDCIAEMRKFWVDEYKWDNVLSTGVRGDLHLGEPTFLTYTDDDYWCLYRHFDFLWNQALHEVTRRVGIEIHKRRNVSQGFSEDYGLKYSPDKYGIYISTSWYQANKGWMQGHVDGHKDIPILQYMLPITHKGIDFNGGGLWFQKSTDSPKIDVDAAMPPGAIGFFDARYMHGVDKVTCSSPNMVGRVASFAIPTFFRAQDALPDGLRRLEKGYFWCSRKIDRVKSLLGGQSSKSSGAPYPKK